MNKPKSHDAKFYFMLETKKCYTVQAPCTHCEIAQVDHELASLISIDIMLEQGWQGMVDRGWYQAWLYLMKHDIKLDQDIKVDEESTLNQHVSVLIKHDAS